MAYYAHRCREYENRTTRRIVPNVTPSDSFVLIFDTHIMPSDLQLVKTATMSPPAFLNFLETEVGLAFYSSETLIERHDFDLV